MSAPTSRDPLVVNTQDGSCWTRRAVSREGRGLYALAEVKDCPVLVLATLAELAEHGLASMADALPVPVGDARQESAANLPRELFLALYDGAEPELFTTAGAARECCDDLAKVDAHGNCWDWLVNEHGVHVQFWTHPDDDRPTGETSGSVTPIVVQGDEPLPELESLRARVAELEAAATAPQEYGPALPWAALMDDEDLTEFLDELAASAITHASSEVALAEVEKTCATWRLIAEAQHGHNTAPGPDAMTRTFAPTQVLREERYESPLHHDYRLGRDLPETGGAR